MAAAIPSSTDVQTTVLQFEIEIKKNPAPMVLQIDFTPARPLNALYPLMLPIVQRTLQETLSIKCLIVEGAFRFLSHSAAL